MKWHLERYWRKGKLYYSYKAGYREKGKVKTTRVYLGSEERASKILADFNSKKPDQEQLYSYTGELLLSKVADRLKFSQIVDTHIKKDTAWSVGQFLEMVVIERCLVPSSKWALAKRYHQQSILSLRDDIPSKAFSEANIYNYMDYFYPYIHQIQASLVEQIYKNFPAENEVLILDGTSFYSYGKDTNLEDQENGEEKQLDGYLKEANSLPGKKVARVHGYSRDKRPDLAQVNVMLGVNQQYFPLYFEVFAGNTVDLAMFEATLHRMKSAYQGLLEKMKKRYMIFDRGNVNDDNLEELDRICHEWDFMFITGVKKVLFNKKLTQLNVKELPLIFEHNNTKLHGKSFIKTIYGKPRKVLLYVNKAVREARLITFQKKLAKVQTSLAAITSKPSLSPAEKVTLIKVILRKHSMVRLFWLPKIRKDGTLENNSQSSSDLYKLLAEKVKKKEGLFGKFAVISSDVKLTTSEIIRHYKTKEIVEHEFHLIKSLLELCPYFHRLPHRIEAHIAIGIWGMLFLSVLRALLAQEGLNYTFEELRYLIRQGFLQKAVYHYPEFKTFRLTRTINISPELEKILRLNQIKTEPFNIEDLRLHLGSKKLPNSAPFSK